MAVSGLITSGLTIPPAAAVNAAANARGLAVAAANALIPVIYGVDRQPALILNVLPKADDATKVLIQCLWGHRLDNADELQLNDRALPAGTAVTTYVGTQTSADAALVAAFAAQGITYADTLQGFAYSVVALPIASFDGQLNVSARLRGRRVYDRRKDSTAGGSGPHRVADVTTWEWSDNPSLCLADWISNPIYGAGEPIDLDSVPAAANANDQLIGSPSEKRRLIGLTLNRDGVSISTLSESLRAYAGVWLVPGGQGMRLLPDAPDTPTQSYSHAAGQIAALDRLRLKDLGDAPTAVEVLYTDITVMPWRERPVVVSLVGAGTALPWRLSSVRLPGVQRYSQARREALERLNKLNARALECSLEVFDTGIRHELADIVEVTHPAGLVAKALRVTDVQMPGPGRWLLELREHDLASYSDVVSGAPSTADTARSISDGPSAAVEGLTGSSSRGRISWTWAPCADTGYGYTEVRPTNANWGSLSPAPLFRGAASAYQETVVVAGTYTRWVRHFGPRGNGSATAVQASVTVAASELVLTVSRTDTEDPNGSGFSNTVAHEWTITPEVNCRLEFTATVWADNLVGDAGNRLGWYVNAAGGPDLLLGGSRSNITARQQIVCATSFDAAGGEALVFQLRIQGGAPSNPAIHVWDSVMRATENRGAVEVPAPPPPPPAPAPPAPDGYWVSVHLGAVVFVAGQAGNNVTTELLAAVALANSLGYWLDLPPWAVHFDKAFKSNKIRGVKGKSKLVPLMPFDYSPTFASQFVITNVNFSQGFDAATADDVSYQDFDLAITPTLSNALIGLGGTGRSFIKSLRLRANRNLVAGKAVPVGALIDYYCTNRNGLVWDCDLENVTGAYGLSGRLGPDGGACAFIRNLRGGTVGQAEAFASENVVFAFCRFQHMASDEAFAIYGVRGIVRKCRLVSCTINGLPTIDRVHQASLISIFPLDDGSALGATAAVYDNDIFDNDIVAAAAMYEVVRIGASADAARVCRDNRSSRNRARWVRSNDPVTGPKAVWVSEGSVGVDPDIASAVFRCIEGTFGLAYSSDSSGNTSTDDVAIVQGGGATAAAAYTGWQKVANPTCYGDIFNAVFACRKIEGGTLEAFWRIFFNVNAANGTRFRQNGVGGCVFEVDSGEAGVFGMKNVEGEGHGTYARISGAAPASTRVQVVGGTCRMSGGAAYYPLVNQSSSGARLAARNNDTVGAIAGIQDGVGTIVRSGNDWNGTTD